MVIDNPGRNFPDRVAFQEGSVSHWVENFDSEEKQWQHVTVEEYPEYELLIFLDPRVILTNFREERTFVQFVAAEKTDHLIVEGVSVVEGLQLPRDYAKEALVEALGTERLVTFTLVGGDLKSMAQDDVLRLNRRVEVFFEFE